MLGIDRQHARTAHTQRRGHQLTCHHKGFLVCKGDILACGNRTHSGGKPAVAYRCRDHGVEAVGLHGIIDCGLPCRRGDAMGFKRILELPILRLIGNNSHFRAPSERLLYQRVDFRSGHKQRGCKTVGILPYHIESLRPYRAGRPQYGHPLLRAVSLFLLLHLDYGFHKHTASRTVLPHRYAVSDTEPVKITG